MKRSPIPRSWRRSAGPLPQTFADTFGAALKTPPAPPAREILLPVDGPEPTFWLTIGTSPELPVLHLPLEMAALQAEVNGGELMKFNYLPTPDYDDPDADRGPRVYGRIRIETRTTPFPS